MDSSSWWQIDPSNKTSGASPLLELCMETYGWKEDKARRVLMGYKQFLTLKKKLGDFNGNILEPSNIIDHMWVQHVSTKNYKEDSELLCGGFVKRDGYARLDTMGRKKRLETTKKILQKAKFDDDVDEEIWACLSNNHSLVVANGDAVVEEETKIIFRPHFSLQLREAHYDVPLYENFVVVACLYGEDQGHEYRALRFVVDGKDVRPDLSLQELGFANNQVVDVMPVV